MGYEQRINQKGLRTQNETGNRQDKISFICHHIDLNDQKEPRSFAKHLKSNVECLESRIPAMDRESESNGLF